MIEMYLFPHKVKLIYNNIAYKQTRSSAFLYWWDLDFNFNFIFVI